MFRAIIITSVFSLLAATLVCPAEARRRAGGPHGTFRNDDGVIKLAYLGEGNVSVDLKTKYCRLLANGDAKLNAVTFVPSEGIAVHDAAGKPLLVIFYASSKIVVWGELERFKANYCKGGLDVTGVYKRGR